MAPTTRAAARRLNSVPSATDVPNHGHRSKQRKIEQPLPANETGYLTDNLCRILVLPAELRNRIYEYAAEEFDHLKWAPPIGRMKWKPWNERRWKFFGLTQTCRQIRSEFGPIWLRKLNIRGSTHGLKDFIPTFFPHSHLLVFGPKRIQILWDVGMHDNKGDRHDLTQLLLLQAHNSSQPFTFVPERLVDGESPGDICWYCFGEMQAEERGEDDFENWVERCTCAPEDLPYDDYVDFQYELISPTDIILALIRHNNKAWQQDVRAGRLGVQCIFGKYTEPITFRILCKERFCEVEGNYDTAIHAEKAWELLDHWGIFELPTAKMNFSVAFKIERKVSRNGYELVSTEEREVCVTKVKTG